MFVKSNGDEFANRRMNQGGGRVPSEQEPGRGQAPPVPYYEMARSPYRVRAGLAPALVIIRSARACGVSPALLTLVILHMEMVTCTVARHHKLDYNGAIFRDQRVKERMYSS